MRINGTAGVPVLINSNYNPYSVHATVLYACILLMLLAPSVFMICTGVFASPQNKGELLLRITSQQEKGSLVTRVITRRQRSNNH